MFPWFCLYDMLISNFYVGRIFRGNGRGIISNSTFSLPCCDVRGQACQRTSIPSLISFSTLFAAERVCGSSVRCSPNLLSRVCSLNHSVFLSFSVLRCCAGLKL